MSYSIDEIEGIGAEFKRKLNDVGIKTSHDLLSRCGEKRGRDGVSTESGISEKLLLEWANQADLMRINGVGEEFADLLEAAGVDTVKELATRNAENLAVALAECNAKKNLTNRVPSAETVQKWVDDAQGMKPMISH